MGVDYQDGDYIYDTFWLAMKRAIEGDAILSGMAVTPGGGMTVDIAAGIYAVGGIIKNYAGATGVAIATAPATMDRFDIITGDSAGAVSVTTGTPHATKPIPPDLPANETLIKAIYVTAAMTVIGVGNIRQFEFLTQLLFHGSRHQNGQPDEFGVAGLSGELADDQKPKDHDHVSDGGTLGADSVDTTQLKDGAVFRTKIQDGAVSKNQVSTILSNSLQNSNDSVQSTNQSGPTKVKETQLDEVINTIRIKFDLRASAGTAYGRIYKNGSPIGTQRSTTSLTFVTFSEDFTDEFENGDLIQIYASTSASPTGLAYVQNFRLYYDIDIVTVPRATTNNL